MIREYLAQLNPAHVGAAALISLCAVGLVFVGEEEFVASVDAEMSPPDQAVVPASSGLVERTPQTAGPGAVAPDGTVSVPQPTIVLSGPVVSGTTPAVRLNNAFQATATLPPPVGLNGLPFAPDGLDGCDLMEWHADQAGLPDDFDWIGWEESGCRNDVNTWCCYGYWQIHELHIGDRSAAECDVDEPGDYFGANPLNRQRNACMAALVYVRQGVCAWDVVGC